MSYMILVTCFASCHTNIIDEGMEGFVEQTTTFGAPSSEEAVDLGLSVKWAPYNVGASKPTEYGNYYAWGEIEPKTDYSSETYVGPADFFGSVDAYGTEYDVAYVKWGHEWRIPTMDELIEIQEKCKWEATEQDGVKGMKVTGPNGNSIFFPAAGRCVGNRFEDVGVTGHYWQGCAIGDGSQTGEYTYYDLNAITNGLTIRPVLVSCAAYEIDKESLNDWDYGCIYGGYCSDITRSFLVGDSNKKLEKVYRIVKEAQEAAIKMVKAGIKASEVDKAARNYIESKGYGKYFTHSTGHGVGIVVHDPISVSSKSDMILQENMVITIEPGIYIPKLGGIRIEDDVLVKKDGYEILTKASKKLYKITK